jgi:RHS repeat-associated protein
MLGVAFHHSSLSYDRFGNRWQQNGSNSFIASFTGNNTTNNNRMDGYSYDGAGNLLNDGAHSYTYDAENRIIAVDGGRTAVYLYDAFGRRVYRTGYFRPNCDTDGKATFLYDLSGHMIVNNQGGPLGSACFIEIYVGERHLARQGGGTYFDHTDWLGTHRLETVYSQISNPWYYSYCASLPFGDGLNCQNSSGVANGQSTLLYFTAKERDAETGLDNFGARFDSSSMGRFMTPDWSAGPSPVPYASLPYPQSLNLYSYVQNNPLSHTDPTGHCTVDGEKHGGFWCWAHRHGLFGLETKKETAAREAEEAKARAWYIKRFGHPPEVDAMSQLLSSYGMAMAAVGGGIEPEPTPVLQNANYAQTTFSETFSSEGAFAGETVESLAAKLRSGSKTPADVPVEYIVRDGNTLILNTRSSQALEQAGIPRSQWNAVNMTGDPAAEARLTGQLQRNNLTSAGTPTVKPQ